MISSELSRVFIVYYLFCIYLPFLNEHNQEKNNWRITKTSKPVCCCYRWRHKSNRLKSRLESICYRPIAIDEIITRNRKFQIKYWVFTRYTHLVFSTRFLCSHSLCHKQRFYFLFLVFIRMCVRAWREILQK